MKLTIVTKRHSFHGFDYKLANRRPRIERDTERSHVIQLERDCSLKACVDCRSSKVHQQTTACIGAFPFYSSRKAITVVTYRKFYTLERSAQNQSTGPENERLLSCKFLANGIRAKEIRESAATEVDI